MRHKITRYFAQHLYRLDENERSILYVTGYVPHSADYCYSPDPIGQSNWHSPTSVCIIKEDTPLDILSKIQEDYFNISVTLQEN